MAKFFTLLVIILLGVLVWFQLERDKPVPEQQIDEPTGAVAATLTYTCAEGAVIEVLQYEDSENIGLVLPEQEVRILAHTIAASGARYANEDGSYIFWSKGKDAFVEINGQPAYQACRLVEPEAEEEPESVAADHELIGTSWLWSHTEYQDATRLEPKIGTEFVLTFEAERVTSTTDCNGLSGDYVKDGEVLSFGPFASTLMYCEGSLESQYSSDLALTNSYILENGKLTLNLNRDYGTMVFIQIERN